MAAIFTPHEIVAQFRKARSPQSMWMIPAFAMEGDTFRYRAEGLTDSTPKPWQ